MKANRRSFLGFMAAAPIAGKAVAEEAIAKRAGINIAGVGARSGLGAPMGDGIATNPTPLQYKAALANPVTRAIYEGLLYEQERFVYAIDQDIGVHRSVSLAAKIVYQRQRNVSRHIRAVQDEYPWSRMTKLIKDTLGVFG